MLLIYWPYFTGPAVTVGIGDPGTMITRAECRSGLCRAGVTRSGMSRTRFMVLLNGVDITAYVKTEECTLSETLNGGAPTFTFGVYGMSPPLSSDIQVLQATPNDRLFGGTLTTRQPIMYGLAANDLHWNCTATGYTWLMNRYALVSRRYFTQEINAIAADLLARYTDGGFRVGYAPQSLGSVAIDFALESVEDALNRLVQSAATDAYWEITPERVLNVYDTYPEGNLPTVTHLSIDLGTIDYRESTDEIRTQAIARGAGSAASIVAAAGAVEVWLDDVAAFSTNGGDAVAGYSIFSYTGKNASAGPGALVGVSGLDYDIGIGESVELLATWTDDTKVAQLASALGSGLSGVAVHLVDAAGGNLTETVRRAETDVMQHGDPGKTLTFRYQPTPRRMAVGRFLTVNLTKPATLTGEFRVQGIETTILERSLRSPDQDWRSPAVRLHRRVTAGKVTRTLAQLLREVA